MKALIKILALMMSLLLTSACSEEGADNTSNNDHVWKEQTDTIDKAKEVEGIMLDSAENARQMIEEQGQ